MSVHQCSLLAVSNPSEYGWEYARKIFVELQKKTDNFELVGIDISSPKHQFRDGEIKPHVVENIRKRNCYFVHDSTLHPFQWFTELALINYIMKNSCGQEKVDVLPYHRFARQEVKDDSRVPNSAKVVADMVGMYVDRIMTIDIHNRAIQGFYDIPFDSLEPTFTFIDAIRKDNKSVLENTVVMSTDTGGGKRARKFANVLGVDFVEGYKYRDAPGEVEKIAILARPGRLSGKKALIIDDICDSRGTLIAARNALEDEGVSEVNAAISHGLFTKGIGYATQHFDRFYVGDILKLSLAPGQSAPLNLRVVSFAPLLAEAIYRTSEGDKLSTLFSER